MTSANSSSDGIEVLLQGRHGDGGRVEVRAGAQRRAQAVQFVADLEGVAGLGALIEHVHGELGGAGLSRLVGRIAGVHQQVQLAPWGRSCRSARTTFSPFASVARSSFGEPDLGLDGRHREFRAIHIGFDGLKFRQGLDFEHIDAVGKPMPGRVPHVTGRGVADAFEHFLPRIGAAEKDLVAWPGCRTCRRSRRCARGRG